MGQITGGCDVSHIATSPHNTKTRPSGKSPRAPFFDAQDELKSKGPRRAPARGPCSEKRKLYLF